MCAHVRDGDERAVKRDEIHAFARGHKAERLWVFGSLAYVPAERGGRYERARVDTTRWGRFCGGCSKEIMKWKFRGFVSAKTAE